MTAAISHHHKLGVGDTTGTQWTEARDDTLPRTNPHNKILSGPKVTMELRLRNYDLNAFSFFYGPLHRNLNSK